MENLVAHLSDLGRRSRRNVDWLQDRRGITIVVGYNDEQRRLRVASPVRFGWVHFQHNSRNRRGRFVFDYNH